MQFGRFHTFYLWLSLIPFTIYSILCTVPWVFYSTSISDSVPTVLHQADGITFHGLFSTYFPP
jgi:hypothetical protein